MIKLTEEHKRKLSESHKGKIPWNKGLKGSQVAWNKGLKGYLKGRKITWADKISEGKKKSDKSRKASQSAAKKMHEANRGKRSHRWKGEDAGYGPKHWWVSHNRGKPKKCEHCGISDPKLKYEWANMDHKYRRKLEDYIRLCVRCHRKYDYFIRKIV